MTDDFYGPGELAGEPSFIVALPAIIWLISDVFLPLSECYAALHTLNALATPAPSSILHKLSLLDIPPHFRRSA